MPISTIHVYMYWIGGTWDESCVVDIPVPYIQIYPGADNQFVRFDCSEEVPATYFYKPSSSWIIMLKMGRMYPSKALSSTQGMFHKQQDRTRDPY